MYPIACEKHPMIRLTLIFTTSHRTYSALDIVRLHALPNAMHLTHHQLCKNISLHHFPLPKGASPLDRQSQAEARF